MSLENTKCYRGEGVGGYICHGTSTSLLIKTKHKTAAAIMDYTNKHNKVWSHGQ